MTTVTTEVYPSQSPGTRLPGLMAAALLGTGLVVDHLPTLIERYRQSTDTDISYFDNDFSGTVLTLPGCRTEVSTIVPMLQTRLAEVANTAYASYPKGNLDVKEVGQKLLEFRRATGEHKPISVLALSMSGIILERLLDDPEFRQRFGRIDNLVFDSAPHQRSDIHLRPRLWLETARFAGYSKSLGYVSTRVQLAHAADHAGQHAAGISDEAVIAHQQATIRTPSYTVANQGRYIRGSRLHGSLKGVAENVFYIQSPHDAVIKTDQAFAGYQNDFDGTITRVVDTDRPHGSHAASPEFPELTTALLTGNAATGMLASSVQ